MGTRACHSAPQLCDAWLLLAARRELTAVCGPAAGRVAAAAGKSVRETDKGFVMCRGAGSAVGAQSKIPLLPVEEQSAEQQVGRTGAARAARVRLLHGSPPGKGRQQCLGWRVVPAV